jgi:hypothetical protein
MQFTVTFLSPVAYTLRRMTPSQRSNNNDYRVVICRRDDSARACNISLVRSSSLWEGAMTDADFRAFIKSERKRLIHYVRSLFRETAAMDAEDVVQDVLVRILDRAGANAPFDDLASYVYRSVRNRVIDLARSRKPMVSLDADNEGGNSGLIELLEDARLDASTLLQTEQGEQCCSRRSAR